MIPPLATPPARVLLPRFDTYGDIVLLSGFLAALRRAWPEAELHLLVRESYRDLETLLPVALTWRTSTVATPYDGRPAEGIPADLSDLLAEPWDLCLATVFSGTWIDEIVLAELAGRGVPCVRLAGPDAAAAPGLDTVPVAAATPEPDKYQALFGALTGGAAPVPAPRLEAPPALRRRAETVLAELGLAPGGYVVCLPGGVQNNGIKVWPADRFARCVDHLRDRHGLATLICGHESEQAIVRSVAEAATGPRPAVWLGGSGDMPLLGALLALSRLYLGNDTGPMHMAQALDVPAVAIFGGGNWPRFLPTGRGAVCFSSWPCYGCNWDCLLVDAPCVRAVPLAGVTGAIDRVLAAAPDLERHDFPHGAALEEVLFKQAHDPAFVGPRQLRQVLDKTRSYLAFVESDRAARLEVIEEQGAMIGYQRGQLAHQHDIIAEKCKTIADAAPLIHRLEKLLIRIRRILGPVLPRYVTARLDTFITVLHPIAATSGPAAPPDGP